MNLANPQILTCPFCGEKKEIMCLMSGNTFGGKVWSDNKCIYPMYPEISFVQKCPHCGKFYIRTRQEAVWTETGYSFEQGLLTYEEMKQAFAQLMEAGDLTHDEEANVRMMLHHAHNDNFRSEQTSDFTDADLTLFRENAMWLIQNIITDNVMKAEFYREIGDFDEAKSILDEVHASDPFYITLVDKIQDKIANRDSAVFQLY
ncbi:MAG: hypothetical protein J6S02_04805 [Bacteroidaceae bacterium]|nr:hypothetical protein [Bacteroidaceae bacterium]